VTRQENGKWHVLIYLKGQKQKYGGIFKDELEAAKRVNQLCEELGIPLQNPTISGVPDEQYQKREKRSQYKGVTWHCGKWYVQLQVMGQKQKYGGRFNDELDAAKKVNQLCEKFGIPLQNPGIVEMPTQQLPHGDYTTIDNLVVSPKIVKTDNKRKKRNREQEFNNDDKLPYFYEHWLN